MELSRSNIELKCLLLENERSIQFNLRQNACKTKQLSVRLSWYYFQMFAPFPVGSMKKLLLLGNLSVEIYFVCQFYLDLEVEGIIQTNAHMFVVSLWCCINLFMVQKKRSWNQSLLPTPDEQICAFALLSTVCHSTANWINMHPVLALSFSGFYHVQMSKPSLGHSRLFALYSHYPTDTPWWNSNKFRKPINSM